MNKKTLYTLFAVFGSALALCLVCGQKAAAQQATGVQNTTKALKKKVLFVVTSHDRLGDTGERTGYHLAEVTHPWKVLTDAGYIVEFVSPQGGKAPVDAFDLSDPVNREFWNNETYRSKIENTMRPDAVVPDQYAAIYFAGGHGTMWDFPNNARLNEITRAIYDRGGVVAAVCHGPAAFVDLKMTDGNYLVSGKRINSFTNEEEIAAGKDKVVPFMLETKLIEQGADFRKSGNDQPHVEVSERVVTGQNPASATGVGEAILKLLNN